MKYLIMLLLLFGNSLINLQNRDDKDWSKDERSIFWSTRLHYEIDHGSLSQINECINSGEVDVNVCDEYGQTPLHHAVKFIVRPEVVYALLKAGANVDVQDNRGVTPLMCAADIPLQGQHGCTNAQDDVNAVISLLLAAKPQIELQDAFGLTALSYYVKSSVGDLERVSLILGAGAKVNTYDHEGRTPLMWAAEYGTPAIVDALLVGGSNINEKDKRGHTALIWAAQRDEYYSEEENVLCVLIDAGAELEATSKIGWTSLAYAAESGFWQQRTAHILLQAGADPTALGWSPLHKAAALGNVELLLDRIENGSDLDARDMWGRTPLMWSVRFLKNGCLEKLIQAGASIEARDDEGLTALMFAAKYTYLEEVGTLLRAGANVNAVDNSGNTPLMYAVERRLMTPISQKLLEHSADINQQDCQGTTALIHAIKLLNKEQITVLIDAGALIRIKDVEGRKAIDFVPEDENHIRKILGDF